jgi:hypothetical protein
MARFINRIQDAIGAQDAGAEYDPAAADQTFDDVPVGSPGADDIYALEGAGIVQGTGANTYDPFSPVLRSQMAFFLMRHLDENIADGRVDSLAVVPSNETLTFGPDDSATIELAGADADDTRDFLAAGLDDSVEYRVTLVESDLVTVDANGFVTFTNDEDDAVTPEDESDFAATGDANVIADIIRINGAVVAAGSSTETANPVNGAITVTIEGETAGSVTPVVYINGAPGNAPADGGVSPRLELDVDGVPIEPFGIAGETTFTNPEAAAGTTALVDVTSVDKAADQFEGDDQNVTTGVGSRFYVYDANDSFRIGAAQATQAEFEAALSSGDDVQVTDYQTNADLVSTFVLSDLDPAQPTVSAAGSTEAGTENDIEVTVTPASTDFDSVVLERATGADATTGFSTIATLTVADDEDADVAGIQYTDADLAVGSYTYRAATVNDGDQGEFSAGVNATATAATTPDTTAPTAVDTRVDVNGGSAFLLESGDTFKVVFSEVMAEANAGDTIRLTDSDGTVVDIANTSGTTASTNLTLNSADEVVGGVTYPAGRVLTVTRGTDTVVVAGSEAGLGIPATITQQSGITDLAGNQWNVAGSADVVVDSE